MDANRLTREISLSVMLCFVFAGSGCEVLYEAGVPGMAQFVDLEGRAKEEDLHRTRYQTERDGASFRWLLSNRIVSGMSREEVEHIIGESGVRELRDRALKGKSSRYLVSDEMYKFGPDSQGRSVYLGFRDNKLVNFDPREFTESDQ